MSLNPNQPALRNQALRLTKRWRERSAKTCDYCDKKVHWLEMIGLGFLPKEIRKTCEQHATRS